MKKITRLWGVSLGRPSARWPCSCHEVILQMFLYRDATDPQLKIYMRSMDNKLQWGLLSRKKLFQYQERISITHYGNKVKSFLKHCSHKNSLWRKPHKVHIYIRRAYTSVAAAIGSTNSTRKRYPYLCNILETLSGETAFTIGWHKYELEVVLELLESLGEISARQYKGTS